MGLLVRRAEPEDQRGLTSLVSKAGGPAVFRRLYGSYNFGQMIETSYVPISALYNAEKDDSKPGCTPFAEVPVGFVALSDKPRAGMAEDWLGWFSETHAPAEAELTMTNVLWVEFAVAIGVGAASGSRTDEDEKKEVNSDDSAATVLESIVRNIFRTLPEIDYLVMSLSKNDEKGDVHGIPKFVRRTFEVLARQRHASLFAHDEVYGSPQLLLCDRAAFLPSLEVRQACVEDNDDLMPVFEAQSDLLSLTYGDFFLGDMIEIQDDQNKALAALVQGRARGLLATSSDLDITLLQKCFELDDYDFLVKIPLETRKNMAFRQHVGKNGEAHACREDFHAAEPLRIFLLGPPGAGKTTLGLGLAARFGSVLISVDTEARLAAEAGSELGGRAMELIDSGEVLPDAMSLKLVAKKLSSETCQQRGWILDGLCNAGGAGELEEAIAAAGEIGEGSGFTVRPCAVLVLDMDSESDVMERVRGRRVGSTAGIDVPFFTDATVGYPLRASDGLVYHETFNPPPEGAGFSVNPLPGDGDSAAVRARLEHYTARCDTIIKTFFPKQHEVRSTNQDAQETISPPHGSVADIPQGGLIDFIRGQPGRTLGCVQILDAAAPVETIFQQACESIENLTTAGILAAGAGVGNRIEDDDGMMSPDTLAALAPNAFAVTLFCLESGLESRATDFLPHAFSLYPDLDYCVVTVPSVGPESVLLRHFTPVPARPGSAFSHVLYIMHRDALPAFKYMRVSRFVGTSHRAGLSRLMEYWDAADRILSAVQDTEQYQDQDMADNPPSAAFVATLGRQVVGIFVADRGACTGEDVSRIRSDFNVEEFVSFDRHRPRNQAVLVALAINPIFAGQCRFAFKEVMRLYDKSVLYWRSTAAADLPAPVPWHMIPLKPRQRIKSQPNKPETSLTEESKITVTSRVVVVGASSTALACLEGLVFTPHLNLTSLTLVSPEGLGAANAAGVSTGREGRTTFNQEHRAFGDEIRLSPTDEDAPEADRMVKMGLERRARIIRSRMVHLDRENRVILLPDDSVVPYDVLVLGTGVQDVTSHRLKLWTRGKPPYDPGIPGYMSLDSPFLRSDVEEMLPELSHECKVIVYATALKALCAVRGLIDLGLTPSQIILVRPAPPTKRAMGGGENYRPVSGNSWSLGDATIDSSVAAIIAEIGITDAGEMKLEDIRRDEGGLLAASFTFSGGGGGHDEFTRIKQRQDKQQQQQQRLLQDQGKAKQRASSGEREEWEERGKRGKQGEGDCGRERSVMRQKKQRESCEDDRARDVVRIECGLLLCGDNPSADPDIFHAVNDSGLVYDGRLVVDSTFGTSDPFILAGGTLTKFSRACGTDMPRHELCNAREVGARLAKCVLQRIDPLLAARGDTSEETVARPPPGIGPTAHGVTAQPGSPRFELPRCVSGQLPGGLQYVRATLPTMAMQARDSRNKEEGGDSDSVESGVVKSFAAGAINSARRDESGDSDGNLHGTIGNSSDKSDREGSGGYCIVRVDCLNRICDMIYCGQEGVEPKFLSKIVGLQLAYLQNLESTFERGDISSWMEFFQRTCFSPLYHDRFPQLVGELRAALTSGDETVADLLAALDKGIEEGMADECLSVTMIQKVVGHGASGLPPSTRKVLEARATDWVRRNRATLPPHLTLSQLEQNTAARSKTAAGE